MNFIYLQLVLQIMVYVISLILLIFIIIYFTSRRRAYLDTLKENKEHDREKEYLIESGYELV